VLDTLAQYEVIVPNQPREFAICYFLSDPEKMRVRIRMARGFDNAQSVVPQCLQVLSGSVWRVVVRHDDLDVFEAFRCFNQPLYRLLEHLHSIVAEDCYRQ
jgi:hypothetical protein